MIHISVVMPVWNGEAFLREAIDSVLGQSFGDFELLVVDDGSTDGTLDILNSYRDARLRVLKQEHGGIVRALNHGVSQARGEWIGRLDADDIALPERLARQWEALQRNSAALLCYTDVTLFGTGNLPARQTRFPRSRAFLAARMCYMCPIVHSTVVFRKDAFQNAGGYLPEERHAEDFGLWGRLIERGPFVGVCEPLVKFRVHEQSVSKTAAGPQAALRETLATRHCVRFLRLDETSARRAYEILRCEPEDRKWSDWTWYLTRCAPRLRWKSTEFAAWLANQTVRCLKS